ncbi:putative membrane protein [Providencia alcalifaciens]|nr:putative membrane protein [Providencia alcalifaciens]
MNTPEKLQTLMYYLTKEAARSSFMEFLEEIEVSEEEYDEIKEWFKQFDIKPYV